MRKNDVHVRHMHSFQTDLLGKKILSFYRRTACHEPRESPLKISGLQIFLASTNTNLEKNILIYVFNNLNMHHMESNMDICVCVRAQVFVHIKLYTIVYHLPVLAFYCHTNDTKTSSAFKKCNLVVQQHPKNVAIKKRVTSYTPYCM